MIILKTPEEIQRMRKACELTSRTLGEIARWVQPGVSTLKLDTIAREFILDNGGKPACLGYGGFPGTVCMEVNDIVVHGFPSDYVLREGDILGTDLVVELDGFNGDMCYTFPVGEVAEDVLQLCRVTKESLYKGINACRVGKRIGDVAHAVQQYAERHGYGVVREMCGHGIGRKMHEDPEVPNYGRPSIGPVIRNGMCLCIEPMINMGKKHIYIGRDGWTCRTRDGKPSAHYEHTLAIEGDETHVLTTFDYVEEVMKERFI